MSRFRPFPSPARFGGWMALLALCASLSSSAAAQDEGARRVELRFTPTARAQLAVWIESADGELFRTVRLTEAVAVRGIGNRPGALQMNSGFQWPYGRRESALPVWAHRRVDAGGQPFERVIFNGRRSEGNASSAGSSGEPRNTRDDYFCLSFTRELSGRDFLDATTCASPFMSNKGRYMTESDLETGYAEPFEEGASAEMRSMELGSLYPPRRDVTACSGVGCGDSGDVATFALDARQAMPEIDAVTMATPEGDRPQTIVFDVPPEWPNGAYVAYAEVHVEGDYNDTYNDESNPTPESPTGMWDYWAINYGYAYRGQPSVVYRVPFEIRPTGGEWSRREAVGYGALHGEDGDVRAPDGTITDDPSGAPGSGADRLRRADDARISVTVPLWDVCNQPEPPEQCGRECNLEDASTCGDDLLCGPDYTCVGICDVPMAPGAFSSFVVENHADEKHSHQWATLRFEVPESPRRLARYEVRVGTEPIVDLESYLRALPAVQPSVEHIELTVPVEGMAGDVLTVDLGGLNPEATYYVGIRAADECNAFGPFATASLHTTPVHFTTVSPCFVATAAYGSEMERRVGVLRRFRDRHLNNHAPGRALVDLYYAVGPHLADAIRGDEGRRAVARAALAPLVWLAERLR